MPSLAESLEPASRHYYVSVLPQTRELLYYPISLGRFDCKPNYQVERCSFHSYLLLVMHSGELRFHSRKGRGVARAGQTLLLDCNLPHGYAAQGPCSFSYMHFDGAQTQAICEAIERQRGLLLMVEDMERIVCALEEIMSGITRDRCSDEAAVSARIYEILMLLFRSTSALSSDAAGGTALDNVIAYVQQHLSEKLTVESVAAQVGYSPSHLSRLFTRENGMPLYKFIRKCRLSRAQYLLSATRKPIEDIAFQTGFPSAANFSQAFRRETGMSPSEYRRRSI